MKTLIVDDEPKARKNLQSLLTEYCPNVEVINAVGTVDDAVEIIEQTNIDLLFLDIEMDGETGFDLLERFEDIDFTIIFITAHDEYALRAFKFSALDYILKPVDIDDLKAAIDKVDSRQHIASNKAQLDYLMSQLKTDRLPPKLIVHTSESLVFIDFTDILRCESDEGYTTVHLVNGKPIVSSKNIKYFEDLLETRNFFRIHRSHLINLSMVKEYIKNDGGYVIMKDNTTLPVSRRKRQEFLDTYLG